MTPPAPQSLAEKLTRLFETIRSPDGSRWSDEDVAQRVADDDGPSISANYVYLLRTGKRDNPTKKHLEALAGFFGVPPAYFFDDAMSQQVSDELDFLAALRKHGVRDLALRASGMSPRKLASILSIIKEIDQIDRSEE